MTHTSPVALVTGASSGIGYAIAHALAERGYQLIVTARRAALLNDFPAAQVKVFPGDLTSPAFQDQLEHFIFETAGRLDYLFNCAGMLETGPIETIQIEKVAAMLRLNVEATFTLTYKLLKRFKQQGYGHVINISSVLGTKVRPTAGAYAASKFAIEALSEALRMELSGTAIQVSCIEPGLVMTELHKDWEVHPKDSMGIHEPLQTADIVAAVLYILQQPAHVRIPKLMILPKDHHI
ncbi:SDR family oxidoreductase [Chitinophaga nivalis]|uniref:SDR family oxidoreductase n=1 Tax=Chitinophaga nivalis TaxID=2991709 RepID=A0ABT3IKE9_9BACT|nr:SDR family oxidoreductase [Chitinophaga nivalis]MCW3465881.1 SDR family oxidoreductase [Chitinophaga nivalis]MCW3484428.1 SDR family oxidoreductase [Chitinophaga nivalis]